MGNSSLDAQMEPEKPLLLPPVPAQAAVTGSESVSEGPASSSPGLRNCRNNVWRNVWQRLTCGCQAAQGLLAPAPGGLGGMAVTGAGSSIPLGGTAGPAVAHQAAGEVGTLGTCLSVAAEEHYCHLENKTQQVFLCNDRCWKRAKSFGFFPVLLQIGAVCSQSEESVQLSVLFSCLLGMLRNPYCHKPHICILQKRG